MKRVMRPFTTADQLAARSLILAGLGEHFGFIHEPRTPDLDDIMAHAIAPGQSFIVAVIKGKIVGTGALISEGERVGRIVHVCGAWRAAQRRRLDEDPHQQAQELPQHLESKGGPSV